MRLKNKQIHLLKKASYMDFETWKPFYHQILKDFNFSMDSDEEAALLLDSYLQKNKNLISILQLSELISKKKIYIFGAGPSLEKSIVKYKDKFVNELKIVADGATSALLKYDILPDIIITDLDGKISDQILANSKGSFVIVHGHGDNIYQMKNHLSEFKGPIMGTIQTNPKKYKIVQNFGGFTDGDRAIFLSNHFNADEIKLIGFDFSNEIGEYSFAKNKDKNKKIKKLKWCKYLINIIEQKQQNIQFL